MANGVKVEMTVDSSGTITGIRAAGEEFERLDEAIAETTQASERQAQAAEDQAAANRETAQSAERNASAQREAAQAAARYAANTDRMAGASGRASELIFSTGDAIQDLQFGVRGASNNIAFMAENFAQMQQQAGGASAALSGVFAALKGPAGIILALQALLALAPTVIDFFSDTEKEAKDAADGVDRLREGVEGFISSVQDDTQNLEAVLGQLRDTKQLLQEATDPRLSVQLPARRQLGMTREEAERALQAVNTLIGQLQVDPQEESFFQALTDFGVPAETADRLAEIATRADEAERETTNLLDRVREVEEISGEGPGGLMPEARVDVPEQLPPDRMTLLERISRDLGQDDFNSIRRINDALRNLEVRFRDAVSDEQRQRIRRLREELQGLRQDMKAAGEEGVNLQQIGVTMGRAIGSALMDAENAAEKLGQALAGIAVRLILQAAGGPAGGLAGGLLQGLFSGAPSRQAGGPVEGGQVYETHGLGEREYFVPSMDGAIVTADSMRAATGRNAARTVKTRLEGRIGVEDLEIDTDLVQLRAKLNQLDEINQLTK
jgi:hypothetical protein